MDEQERCRTVDSLTKIVNDEMGLREQLEIIRIINPDARLKRTDTQFVIGNTHNLMFTFETTIIVIIVKTHSHLHVM